MKNKNTVSFKPAVYQSPLGYNYTQPIIFTSYTVQQQGKRRIEEDETLIKDQLKPIKRSSMIRSKVYTGKRKVSYNYSETEESETQFYDNYDSYETIEEDPYEKLLKKDGDKFYVKFKNMSYIHCDWVDEAEIVKTRSGLLKVKKFKPIEIKEDWTTVDRVLCEGEEGIYIKWKGQDMPYELSTFEIKEDVQSCVGFKDAYNKYLERKQQKHNKHNIDWRPAKEKKYSETPVYKNGNTLRMYQLEGLNWLLSCWQHKQSCIMADEMGLGKTVQSVVFINELFESYQYCLPVIVVAPLSTLDHWTREFENWTNLRVLKYHGTKFDREIISQYEFFYKSANIKILKFDVLVTSYEMVMTGLDHLSQFEFGVGIFDEAHRLKNPDCKAGIALRSLNYEHKILLSGTPIQNNLNELWSLLNFVNPERFNSLSEFLNTYRMESPEDVERLQNMIKCFMLRRMKDDVETSIPSKEETIIEVELTTVQKRYYRAILEKNIEFLRNKDTKTTPSLMNIMMEIRKCCIHPYLINGAESYIIPEYLRRKGESRTETINAEEYYQIFVESSGKLVLLDKLLYKLRNQHKVLIFSQMTKCLDLLEEYLKFRNYPFERIDGAVKGSLRQEAIDRFSTGNSFVFLLCTRAGGVGINLTAADTCIIFDSDWNPQNDLQAQARCHRIGQKNAVKIYRVVTKNTYEREMFDKAGLKLGLDRAILQKMSFDNKPVPASEKNKEKLDSIQMLLKKGAYGALMDNDDEADKFCEENIDKILERSTVVQKSESGNVFSKATFQFNEEIDDPFFWDFIVNQKKGDTSEMKIRRHCRKLAREGSLSEIMKEDLINIEQKLGAFF